MLYKRILHTTGARLVAVFVIILVLLQLWNQTDLTKDRGRVRERFSIHFIYDYDRIFGRSWCTIESACRAGLNIEVLARDPKMFDEFPLICEDRLHVRQLNFDDLFEGTLLKEWYNSPYNRNSSLWGFDVPDAARWAIVKKYGGIYSDLDILFFGNKLFKTQNKVAQQHDDPSHGHYINGNFLDFQKGHPFVDRAIKEFVSRYKPEHDWGAPGPALITTTMNNCQAEKGRDCKDLTILSADRLQYIRPGELRKNFEKSMDEKDTQLLRQRILEHGLGLHFSNSEIGHPRFPINSLFHSLLNEFCPVISAKLHKDLFE